MKKIVYLTLFILITISCVLTFIIINRNKHFNIERVFIDNVKNGITEKYEYCDDIDITGEFNDFIVVRMSKEFNYLDYYEIEKDVIDITKNTEYMFEQYVNAMKRIDNKYEGVQFCNISIISEDNVYQYYNKTKKLTKNNEEYNAILSLKEKLNAKINEDKYKKYFQNISDEESIKHFLEIENLNDCKSEIVYQYAKTQYSIDNYNEFNIAYDLIKDYKDINELHSKLQIRHKFDGEWYGKMPNASDDWNFGEALNYATHKWIFCGNKAYLIYSTQNKKNTYDSFYIEVDNNSMYVYKNNDDVSNKEKAIVVMNYINEELQYKHKLYTTSLMSIHKTSDNTELPLTIKVKDPKIGMNKKEIESSTWGYPDKKNSDTYSWGTREQWVYKNKGYIYFENGKVTSISER